MSFIEIEREEVTVGNIGSGSHADGTIGTATVVEIHDTVIIVRMDGERVAITPEHEAEHGTWKWFA